MFIGYFAAFTFVAWVVARLIAPHGVPPAQAAATLAWPFVIAVVLVLSGRWLVRLGRRRKNIVTVEPQAEMQPPEE